MKYLYILIFSLPSLVFSQDLITKTNGETIPATISEIGIDKIKYYKSDNSEGPLYIIAKNEVAQIDFENGTTEKITKATASTPQNEEISLEETKAFLLEYINAYGYEEDSFKLHYKAQFEGNYLRLIVLKKNSQEAKNNGILYDFSNVFKFQKVSRRSGELAFINIWVSILKNEKKNKWDKHKLIMRVKGLDKADSILKALKHFNTLLTEAKNPDAKF